MKKLIALIVVVAAWSACKESVPPIIFGEDSTLILPDTAYVLASGDIPEAQFRGVLIEDITGVKCVNCPSAAAAASEISANATTNKVVILGLYPTGFRALTFPFPDYIDPRTEVAQNIGANIYQFASLPAGGVNRKIFDGETKRDISFNTWENRSNSFEGEKSDVNIEVVIDQVNDSTFNVNSNFIFTAATDSDPFVTLMLLEDNIKHPQYYSGGTDKEYKHKHVVRKAYTPYNGTPLLPGEISETSRGLRIEKGWQIIIPSDVDVDEASIAVFINYNDEENREVAQCTEVRLK
ncbi:MAG: Omp28-related outer membrane protein [Bacteroidia bacterium]|jgi:hypothetical protein|nr:Omp28-related outer membrane protein [Bacteroidia bacterium]